MISPEHYYTCYLGVVSVLTIIVCLFGEEFHKRHILAFLLCVAIIIFIGFRPIASEFVDMMNYHAYFVFCKEHFSEPILTIDNRNLLFSVIFSLFVFYDWPEEYFYFIISIIYFGCMFWACRKIFPDNTFLAFLVCLAAFSTFSYGTNGIKAGAAASLFLLAIAYHDKLLISISFAILSFCFHHSMIMVIGAFVIVHFIKKPDYYFVLWIICIVISALHITWFQELFSLFADESGAGYLNPEEGSDNAYITGFRLDFILYSSVPIIIYKLISTKYLIKSENYDFIINLYMLTNSIWLLCMYANFTNRIAYLSWFIFPIAIIYPFLKLKSINNNVFYLNVTVIGHLIFTLFMIYIYDN